MEGIEIDPARLAWPNHAGPLVVEGAGGVLVPLSDTLLYADLMAQWQRPVLLVARLYLGAINHTLLSLEALQSRGVPLAGIVFGGDAYPAVEQAVARFAPQVPIWGRFPQLGSLTPHALLRAYDSVLKVRVEGIKPDPPQLTDQRSVLNQRSV
jgi:dethiobiotin synthetase